MALYVASVLPICPRAVTAALTVSSAFLIKVIRPLQPFGIRAEDLRSRTSRRQSRRYQERQPE